MKVHIFPEMSGEDNGDGGIRRVIEGQKRSMPRLHVSFVKDPGDADLIACHATVPDEYRKRFPDKPLVVHNHGLYWSDYQWADWAYKVNRNVLQAICMADASTAPSKWVADVIQRHTSRPVTPIYHGINTKEWRPPADHKGFVLWNKTRVDPVCEVDSLNMLTALAKGADFVTTFGEKRPNVVVTGKLPFEQGKELIRSAEIYLATSRETFGVGTLEAMACGVPVVGYRFGGQAEFIEHEVDGYLVDPGDIRALVEGLDYVHANRERMSLAAREKASRFTWEAAAEAYLEVYRRAIDAFEAHQWEPRVTIVVPAYNLEQYLPDTLRSIQNQEDKDWECIVVDDDSPDACGDIADAFAEQDERFRVIHNEKNLYLAESRNVAIREARGRYILPVDADDMITPRTVGLLADALDEDRTLQSVYGNVLFTEEDGRTPRVYPSKTPLSPGHSGWPVPSNPVKQVEGSNLQPYASMFRKSAWEAVGGYRVRLKTAEDADFWTRLASWGFRSELVTPEDTLIYRNREGSMSRVNDSLRLAYLKWYPWSIDFGLAPAGIAGNRQIALLTPHVSVIIPVGPGHERMVQDAIDSVAAQSYKYWECIVVNDTGEDLLLPAWVHEYKTDARDTAAARNLGISHARGEVFLPLDADDFLQPDALQWMISAYEERGRSCVIYPDMFEDPIEPGKYSVYEYPDWSCAEATRRMVHSVTALTPVSVWKAVGGYTEGMQWEDWDFQLKIAEYGTCSYRVAAPLFTYRKFTGTRRNYDSKEELEARLSVINERWGEYREGKKHFMACGCKGSSVRPPSSGPPSSPRSMGAPGEEATLVEYTGNKAGGIRYRGKKGALYSFAAGDEPKWVAADDLNMFSSRPDFRVLPNGATPVVAGVSLEPVLSA